MDIESIVRSRVTVVRESHGRSGKELEAWCPVHETAGASKSPSFRFNVDKGAFICLAASCGVRGYWKQFLRITGGGEDDIEAEVAILQGKIRSLKMKPAADRKFTKRWLTQFDIPHRYWEKRGISPSTQRKFRLGYDPNDNAVTIPLFTRDDDVLGVIKRKLSATQQRYTQPKGFIKQRYLYGLHAVESTHTELAIVEGPIDALAMWDAGMPAVAVLGSHLSPWQAKMISACGVSRAIVWTDNNEAGAAASAQFVEALHPYSIFISVAGYRLDMGDDPAACSVVHRRRAMRRARTVKGPERTGLPSI